MLVVSLHHLLAYASGMLMDQNIKDNKLGELTHQELLSPFLLFPHKELVQ